MATLPAPVRAALLRSCVPTLISTGPGSSPGYPPQALGLVWIINVSPRTSIAMRSSAVVEPVALANGATPVVSATLYGPSTRILVKPSIPKLRIAALAGAARASEAETAKRKVRMPPPSTMMVNGRLRTRSGAADAPRAGLADGAFGSARNRDIARAHDVDIGGTRGVRAHAAGAGDGDLCLLRLNVCGVDIT